MPVVLPEVLHIWKGIPHVLVAAPPVYFRNWLYLMGGLTAMFDEDDA